MNATIQAIVIGLLRSQFGSCMEYGKPVPFEFRFYQLTIREQNIIRTQENLDELRLFLEGEEGVFHEPT